MRKLFFGLAIFFGLVIGGFFILDNFVMHGFFTAMGPALVNPSDVTAQEQGIDKIWGKKQFLGSIIGPRNEYTERTILVGMQEKKPSICESLKDHAFEYNRCSAELALMLTDKSLCDNLNNSLPIFDPTTCKITIDGIINQDANECVNASVRGQDICYQDVARILKDSTICENLSNSNHRCYWNLAVSLESEDLCTLSPYPQACTSIAQRDGSMCGLISDEIERSKCFYYTGILTNDANLCKNLSDDLSSNVCKGLARQCSDIIDDCTFLAQRYT